jgi:hypothetical protein
MRPFPGPLALAVVFASSLFIGSALILAPKIVHAIDPEPALAPTVSPQSQTCSCQDAPGSGYPAPRPRFADAQPPPLDLTDETATLEAVHTALSEVGDGASYVWHRRGGKVSGIVKPTASFKDAKGRVCRHLVMTLNSGERSARTEGIACRMADRSWRLEG